MIPTFWRGRLMVLAALAASALMACGQRLYQLQIVEGNVHQERARQNAVVTLRQPAPRGRILDRGGHVLATTEPRFAITAIPAEVGDLKSAAAALGRAMKTSPASLLRKLRRAARLAPLEPCTVARSLSASQVEAVAAVLPALRGVSLRVLPQRCYPQGTLASHELGYVGQISAEEYSRRRRAGCHADDVVGQSGLEAQYDELLRGRDGGQQVAVDAMGRTVQRLDVRPPEPGDDICLSLDLSLQRHCEQILGQTLDRLSAQNGERTAGAVVMLEANTGRVLALASLPNFTPAWYARGLSDAEYRCLMRDPLRPLLSRAYQAAYPPGSTFKVINASACLQYRICTPTSHFYCTGEYRGFHCFVRSGHGHLNFTEALAQSCDATFYRLGDMLGIERLARMAHAFGLGRRTGVDLPDEQDGLFATPAWKRRVYHEPWAYYDTINMAIGQGMMNVTPLQSAVAVAAIANGGRIYRPHLVDRVLSASHRVVWRYQPRPLRRVPVEPRFLAAVRTGMKGVVDHGTGVAARSPIISIAGKTGTAEAVPTVDNPHARNHTWFVSYAPVDHPQIVTVVLVVKAGGYGGGVAAPIARDCIEYWATHVRQGHRTGPPPRGGGHFR